MPQPSTSVLSKRIPSLFFSSRRCLRTAGLLQKLHPNWRIVKTGQFEFIAGQGVLSKSVLSPASSFSFRAVLRAIPTLRCTALIDEPFWKATIAAVFFSLLNWFIIILSEPLEKILF